MPKPPAELFPEPEPATEPEPGTVAGPGPIEAPDPFDPARLRLDPAAELVGIKRVIANVPIRRPKRQEFVRVHPDPAYRVDTAILDLEEDGDNYMVVPELRAELGDELKAVTLFTATNRANGVFLWPVRLSDATGRRNPWAESARRGAELAMQRWMRLSANRAAGEYDLFEAAAALPEPEWPDLTFRELLRLAFRDAVIESIDHPAVRRLRGLM